MSAYIQELNRETNAKLAIEQAQRAEKERANLQAVRERLTPLDERLARLLATIPLELQREGLSLHTLQASLRGRSKGRAHPGEIGEALRRAGYRRERKWRGDDGCFKAAPEAQFSAGACQP